MRSFIESLLPYRLMHPVMARRQARQNEQWQAEQHRFRMSLRGTSWADVRSRSGGYGNDQSDALRVARWANRPVGRSLADASVLSLLLPTNGKEFHITDFGGGTGDVGEELSHLHPNVRYTVVETPRLVGLMLSHERKPPVVFTSDMPPTCDVFYTSGTLHYLDEPLAVLEQGLRSARDAAVVRRTRFSDPEIYDVQVSRLFDNGLGPIPAEFQDCELRAPRRTLREQAVTELAGQCGFDVSLRTVEADSDRDVYIADMVFRRVKQ